MRPKCNVRWLRFPFKCMPVCLLRNQNLYMALDWKKNKDRLQNKKKIRIYVNGFGLPLNKGEKIAKYLKLCFIKKSFRLALYDRSLLDDRYDLIKIAGYFGLVWIKLSLYQTHHSLSPIFFANSLTLFSLFMSLFN